MTAAATPGATERKCEAVVGAAAGGIQAAAACQDVRLSFEKVAALATAADPVGLAQLRRRPEDDERYAAAMQKCATDHLPLPLPLQASMLIRAGALFAIAT